MKKLIYILFFALLSFGAFAQVGLIIKNNTHRDLYIQSIDLYENANGVSYFYVDYPNNPYPNPPLLHFPSGEGEAFEFNTPIAPYQFPFPDEFPFQTNVLIGPGPVVPAPWAPLPLTDPSPNFFEYCKYYFDNGSNQDGFGKPIADFFTPAAEIKYHNGTNIQYKVEYFVIYNSPTNYYVYLTWTDI